MTDDLKNKFEQLVADPPPPSTVPSEAVFARVRTARRRRTAGALTLTAAAVVAVAFAVNNVTDIDGRPPVSNTPTVVAPTSTPPPSSTPTTTPTSPGTTTSTHVGGIVHSPDPNTQNTNGPKTSTPPPASTSKGSNSPAAPQLGVHVTLKPTVQGRTVTMKVTLSGTERVPTDLINHRPLSTSTTDFVDLLGGTQYFFGDGQQSGSDVGAVNCLSGTQPTTGHQTYTLLNSAGSSSTGTYTYANAGTYTFKYTVKYCGNHGWVPVTKTTKVTVK